MKILKKFLIYSLVILYIFSLTACGKKKEEEKPKVNAFEIKVSENVVRSYMNLIMKEDYQGGKKLYTKDLSQKASDMPISNIKIKGYSIVESNEVGRSGVFRVRVTRTSMTTSISSLDEDIIKVVKDGVEYKIGEITSTPQKESFIERGGIRFRDKKNVKTNLVIDVSGLPKYTYSSGDGAQLYKMLVPTKEFSSINFNYEGDRLAISTYDKNSFIGIVNIDESLAVQGGTQNAGAEQQGGGASGGGSEVIAKEKPIGQELIALDLLQDTKVEFMTFSLDGKFLVVQYIKSDATKCIGVYKTDNGDMIPINFEKDYPIDKVQIIFNNFGENTMTYEVLAKANINSSEANVIGKWKLDLKEFKIDKL